MQDNSNKIILDLCGGTGSWSKPYKDAGYDVRVITMPKHDLRNWMDCSDILEAVVTKKVYGILAAPPCTMFSTVRTTPKKPRSFQEGMEIVNKCLEIIHYCRYHARPTFWALENPRGFLRQFLGNPPFSFDPSEFGDSHNKKTDLWGYFTAPKKTHIFKKSASIAISNSMFKQIPPDYVRDPAMRKDAIQRSMTPQGFAQSFYRANQ